MATPEGKIKDAVKKVFKRFGDDLYHHMPVQNGMGRPTLDFTGAIRGRAFAVETKAPGKKPTDRQMQTIREMENAGIKVFVIDEVAGPRIEELNSWLIGVQMLMRQPEDKRQPLTTEEFGAAMAPVMNKVFEEHFQKATTNALLYGNPLGQSITEQLDEVAEQANASMRDLVNQAAKKPE